MRNLSLSSEWQYSTNNIPTTNIPSLGQATSNCYADADHGVRLMEPIVIEFNPPRPLH